MKYANLEFTPQFAEGKNFFSFLKALQYRSKNRFPKQKLPTEFTPLHTLYSDKPQLVWFGHSSYFIQYQGINFLIDPVLSGSAAPFSFMVKAFPGVDVYTYQDFPEIDFLIITHNHYDHLDLRSIKALAPNIKQAICPQNVIRDLTILSKKGISMTELNWWQSKQLHPEIEITATPARHFSRRSLARNTSLWNSYVLQLGNFKLFLGGDSGHGSHFEAIGKKFERFDLAILECGQYNDLWPYIHSIPEQLPLQAKMLNAQYTLPVHWAKFSLAMHAWNEPIQRFIHAANASNTNYITPKIGEKVSLYEEMPLEIWWT